MIVLGITGYFFLESQYPTGPLLIGLMLGPMLESDLRKFFVMFKGDLFPFVDRPVATVFFSISLVYVSYTILSIVRRTNKQ
jgi:putative tricarboxylic transport membrane protein